MPGGSILDSVSSILNILDISGSLGIRTGLSGGLGACSLSHRLSDVQYQRAGLFHQLTLNRGKSHALAVGSWDKGTKKTGLYGHTKTWVEKTEGVLAESADVLQGQDSALWHRRTHTQAAGHLGGQAALCCFYQKRTGTGSSPHR